MSPFLQLAVVLSIIIATAKLAGYISRRLNQPSVFGELVVGLLLGPSLINLTGMDFIDSAHLDQTVHELAELGVLLLMFLAGMELHIDDLARNTHVAASAGALGVLAPVLLGALVGLVFQFPLEQSLFLGLALGATSVSISAQTLIEMKKIRTRVGLGLLGAAVFDDVLVILLVSIMTALVSGSLGPGQVVMVIGRMLLFILVGVLFGQLVLPRLIKRVARMSISHGLLALAIVVMLLYGIAAELIGGMAAITGTFIAGLMVGRANERHPIETGMQSLAYGFFVPIFFVDIGLQVDLHDLSPGVFWLMLLIVLVAVAGKIAGAGVGARMGGFTWKEALQLGIGMVSRGEVGLIVASVGLTNNLITADIFTALVGMILITTLLTPPLLRASFRWQAEAVKSSQ